MFVPPEFHPSRQGIVSPVRVDRRGLEGPTQAQARGREWRRSSRGFYLPSWADADRVEQRIVEAAVILPGYGGVTGWAMLGWAGDRWFEGRHGSGVLRDVTLAIAGLNVRERPGVSVSKERLEPADLTEIDGLRVTTAVRSVCFEMRYAPSLLAAVTVLDMAAYADLVSVEELTAYALAHPGWTGIPRCRDAIPYAEENAWSPTEVEMRWIWTVEAGFSRPLCNRPVFDRAGRHLGTPDLIDPVAGVVGEYEGSLHLAGKRRARDLERESDFRSVGLEYVTMVTQDRRDHSSFIERLNDTYSRARFEAEAVRRWTLEPPARWIPTFTVDQRRELDEVQRARLLRYRRAG
ncbi:hypothetical protein [Nocardioides sp. YIM 152315]|uniref:hypothetical protein n=1 Tax=Nocardioides sp. YIM 152315 TaxID=3031760 RepID=UPI0023D9FA16|nr:hypothetical protein [Nocardioides sp. YIM 152315]MDF1603099.1 hypothetical protein [Nocardioides sp. YIM 152315]